LKVVIFFEFGYFLDKSELHILLPLCAKLVPSDIYDKMSSLASLYVTAILPNKKEQKNLRQQIHGWPFFMAFVLSTLIKKRTIYMELT